MKTLIATVLLIAVAACAGCQHGVAPLWSQAAPETYVEFDPVSKRMILHNSKDTTLKIEEATAKKGADGEYEMTIKNVDLIDNASNPRLANVQQLAQVQAITREMVYPLAVLASRVSTNPTAVPYDIPPPWAPAVEPEVKPEPTTQPAE